MDCDDIVLGAFADKPKDPEWDDGLLGVHDAFCSEADSNNLRSAAHTRGKHVAVNTGILLPPGSQTTSQARLGRLGPIIRRLVGNEWVARMALFQSGACSAHTTLPALLMASDSCI